MSNVQVSRELIEEVMQSMRLCLSASGFPETMQKEIDALRAALAESIYRDKHLGSGNWTDTTDKFTISELELQVEQLQRENAQLLHKLDIAVNDLVAMKQASEAALKPGGEPVYAFRRKGMDDFCTCDARRYLEFKNKPHMFEVTIFYRAAPPAQTPPPRFTEQELIVAYNTQPGMRWEKLRGFEGAVRRQFGVNDE